MPPLLDSTPTLWKTTTLSAKPTGIPAKIIIQAIKPTNTSIEITSDKKITLIPNGKDRVTIRVTIKDVSNSLVNPPGGRKVKFEVEAQPPAIDIGGKIEVAVRNKGKKDTGDRIRIIYEGSGTGKKVADKVIPRGTISATEKVTQKGQAEIIYKTPNLGGNQEKPAVDKVTVMLPAQAKSNQTDLKDYIEIRLSYGLSLVNESEGYTFSQICTGKYATQSTIKKIQKAGKLWKAVQSRDVKIFEQIKGAKTDVDEVQKALADKADYKKLQESVDKSLQKLDAAKKVQANAKIDDKPIDDDLQIIRNKKNKKTSEAITEAEGKLNETRKEIASQNSSEAEKQLERASEQIRLAYNNLEFASEMPQKFEINALSLRHGGIYAPHLTHRDGKDVDIGLMGSDGGKRHVPIEDRDKVSSARKYWRGTWIEKKKVTRTYDRPLTLLLVKVFKDVGASKILIKDANISGSRIVQASGHHHHIHVDFD